MSYSLINKGLELIEEDFHCPEPALTKFNAKINSNSSKQISDPKAIKNRTRNDKNVKRQQLKRKADDSFTNRKIKSAFDSRTKHKIEDHTLGNIEALNKLDENFKTNVNIDKVKEYNLSKLTKSNPVQLNTKKVKETSKSVFSEEDFERMNNEWLNLA